MKLGVIGAGSIVQHHLEAAIFAGFTPVAIAARDNSPNPSKFTGIFPEMKSYSNVDSMIDIEFDALLIAISGNKKFEIYQKFKSRKIPILIEKPFIDSKESFLQATQDNFKQVIFGYNRRHYSSVLKLKNIISDIEEGMIEINIPELSWSKYATGNDVETQLSTNTVHMIDLLNYLVPTRTIKSLATIKNKVLSNFFSLQFSTDNIVGNFNISYGSPDSYQIKLLTPGKNFELSPIEDFKEFVGMEVSPTSKKDKIKRYQKIKSSNGWHLSREDQLFKPGFVQQYKDLLEMIKNPIKPNNSARISDEIRVYNFIEGLKNNNLNLLNG